MRSSSAENAVVIALGVVLLLVAAGGAYLAGFLAFAGVIVGAENAPAALFGLSLSWFVPMVIIGLHLIFLRWLCHPWLDRVTAAMLAISSGLGAVVFLTAGSKGAALSGELVVVDLAILGAGLFVMLTNRGRCDEA